MSFEELGVVLRQERERRGLSVEEVADRLKLMPRVVRAIEQGDFGELPQAAYARGFVKAYGTLLALDTELLYAGLEEVWPEDSHPLPIPYEPTWERKSGGEGRLAAIITLTLILAAAGLFWLSRDLDAYLPSGLRFQTEPAISVKSETPSPPAQAKDAPQPGSGSQPAARQTSPSPPPIPVKNEAPSPPAQVKDAPQPGGGNQTAVRQTSPGSPPVQVKDISQPGGGNQTAARQTNASPLPAGSPAPAAAVTPAAPTESAQAESAPTATLQAAPSSASLRENQRNLVIIALAECWVHSTADNMDTRQFSLRKGDTFVLTFSKKLVLRLGNAGGVKIRLDGRDLGPPGEVGQVKTLTFPANP